jgi:predicted nucleic-acid-binding protein
MTDHLRHDLEESLGLSDYLINRLIDRAPYSYKVYTIPKRSGGQRTIAQPAKEIKFIQRWLIQNIFDKLPVHECASAYKDGASIKKNANSHKSHSYVIKLDFKDFFPSITSSDLVMHISKHLGQIFGAQDVQDIARVSCIRLHGKGDLCLSVGAPSSPVLSNTIMFSFDSEVSAWCAQNGITYTRYADDLTFSTSTKGICSEIESFVMGVTQELDYPNLTLNFNKTTHLSKKHLTKPVKIVQLFEMKTIDTNYLVRLFTNQPKDMANQAVKDLEQSEPGEILLPDFVISELIYVLEFHKELSYKRSDIIEGIRLILSHPAWKVDSELHSFSLTIYETSKLDYVDCLIIALYKLKRVDSVFTFDKEVRKQLPN